MKLMEIVDVRRDGLKVELTMNIFENDKINECQFRVDKKPLIENINDKLRLSRIS